MDNDAKDWDCTEEKKTNVAPPEQTRKKYDYDLFINVKPNKESPTKRKIRIRLASKPIHYGMHWMAFKPILEELKKKKPGDSFLANKKSYPVKTPYYRLCDQKYDAAWEEGGWKPMPRHACWAFDRADPNHIKVLDGSNDIFKPIGEWANENNVNPSCENGTDWVITVDINKAGKMEIISVLPGLPTPFTDEEKKLIETNKLVLNKVLKISDYKEIRKLWMELPDDKKINPKHSQDAQDYKSDGDEGKALEKRFSKIDEELSENIKDNSSQAPVVKDELHKDASKDEEVVEGKDEEVVEDGGTGEDQEPDTPF